MVLTKAAGRNLDGGLRSIVGARESPPRTRLGRCVSGYSSGKNKPLPVLDNALDTHASPKILNTIATVTVCICEFHFYMASQGTY